MKNGAVNSTLLLPLPKMSAPPKMPAAQPVRKRIDLSMIGREPFRIFFLLGTLAGIIGVALWPLHLSGAVVTYPGMFHARIMTYGFFGAFIFGFLGTALPRMLSAKPLGLLVVASLAGLHIAMLTCFAVGNLFWGDLFFLLVLAMFALCVAPRFAKRKDTPPPGFVLVGLSFLCVGAGGVIGVIQHRAELDLFWINLQRLLSYQAFILLPILGIGPFILPRFFGMQSTHDFPEFLKPSRAWTKKAILAGFTGLIILASFFLEAWGSFRLAYGIRFLAVATFLFLEMPFQRAPKGSSPFGASIRLAFAMMAGGFLLIALFPGYRVGLLHLTLVGGFALITFVVATRVVFGHSGNIARLKGPNRWLWITIAMMFLGMATRISGDIWPAVMASHYIYGALLWIAGVLLWSLRVLPLVMMADDEN
jgi:uncharacterized protein involved in response to NO